MDLVAGLGRGSRPKNEAEEQRDGLDVISPSSPLGTALIGAKLGETVSFEAPTGAEMQVTVRNIEV